MSVVASVVFGFILLVAVTRALPAEPVFDLYIVPTSWVAAMGQSWGTFILFICCVAQFFCLTASVTSASRMLFAFSRDRAVPGHQLWRRVSANRVPHMAVIAIVVAAAALMLPTLYNFFIGYYVGTGHRGDRPLHRVHPARDPALPDEGRVRAGRLDARQALQVDRPDRDRLGLLHRDRLPDAAVLDQRAVEGRLHVGGGELRAAPRRRSAAPVRRLVDPLRQQAGSRARSEWAPRRSSSGWRRRSRARAGRGRLRRPRTSGREGAHRRPFPSAGSAAPRPRRRARARRRRGTRPCTRPSPS